MLRRALGALWALQGHYLSLRGGLSWEVLWEHILELFQQLLQSWEPIGLGDLLQWVRALRGLPSLPLVLRTRGLQPEEVLLGHQEVHLPSLSFSHPPLHFLLHLSP